MNCLALTDRDLEIMIDLLRGAIRTDEQSVLLAKLSIELWLRARLTHLLQREGR